MQYCAVPGCSSLVPHGRCPSHALHTEHQRDNYPLRRWYRQVRWKRLRAQVLLEACYTCAACGQVQRDLDVDHITPHEGDRALFFDRSNLQALCVSCHLRKTRHGF